MPATSQKQLKLIYAMRDKYKNKNNAPDKWKWVFDKEWTDNVKMKELPEMNLTTIIKEMSQKTSMHNIDGVSVQITSEYSGEENKALAQKIIKKIQTALDGKTKISNITVKF